MNRRIALLIAVVGINLMACCCGGFGGQPKTPVPPQVVAVPPVAKLPPKEEEKKPEPKPLEREYKILRDAAAKGGKPRHIQVRIEKRVAEAALRPLYAEISDLDRKPKDRTTVAFLLPEMRLDADAWARATYEKDTLVIRIVGLTIEQAAELSKAKSDPTRDVIGSWLYDAEPNLGAKRIAIFVQEGKVFMEDTFLDGSSGSSQIVERPSNEGRRFEELKFTNIGRFFLIDKQGDLQFWDASGHDFTAAKIGVKK